MSRRALSIVVTSVVFVGVVALLERPHRKPTTVELPALSYDENEVRDRDIEFYTRRIQEDPSSALDRAVLARLLFARARTTGSTNDLDRSEQLVRASIDERSHRNY